MQYVLVLMGLWFLTTVAASWTVCSLLRVPCLLLPMRGKVLSPVCAFLYALATAGQAGVANLLNLIEKEMKVAMTLTGAKSISEITQDSLVQGLGKELPAALAPMAKGNAA